jgi:hypothetical protein
VTNVTGPDASLNLDELEDLSSLIRREMEGELRIEFRDELRRELSNTDTFLTSLASEGLVKPGDTYYSLDYDKSEHQITIDIDAAFGSIRVEWMD